jgi:septum formation protein
MKIILGSSSKYRKEILQEIGIQFDVIAPDIDEKAIRFKNPKKLVTALAHAKADILLQKIKEPALIITADQVVSYHGEIREKPATKEEARYFLQTYGKYPIEFVNGLVVSDTVTRKQFSGIDVSRTFTKPFPQQVIESIIEKEEIFHIAGGITLSDTFLTPYIIKHEGTRESRKGLPLKLLESLLQKAKLNREKAEERVEPQEK